MEEKTKDPKKRGSFFRDCRSSARFSKKSQTRQLSKSRSALYYEVDPDLDSLKGFRLITVNFLIEPAFRSSPHAYYYRDTGAIAVSLVVW